MAIRQSHREAVAATAQAAFEVIDDLPATKIWLDVCESLNNLDGPPNSVGDRLEYRFRQGGTTGQMEGEIMIREPGRRLVCRYDDPKFKVTVDLSVDADASNDPQVCVVEQILTIEPKGWIGRLMSPLISMGLRRQSHSSSAALRQLIESRYTTTAHHRSGPS